MIPNNIKRRMQSKAPNLQTQDLKSFAALLAEALGKGGQSFAFFLGAGCSVSSGILPASTLSLQWIRELKRIQTGTSLDAEAWYSKLHPDFDSKAPGSFYGHVIQERFPNLALRRMEAQRFISNKDPGFGYVTLASMISDLELGPRCNVVLTTNFDDLLYDALNLFYNVKPLVIAHEDLARFALPELKRALILKLHGDAFLEPRHTEAETRELSSAMSETISGILRSRGLIFLGYRGGDQSIASMLRSLPQWALPYGVYWVNENLPSDAGLVEWLAARRAVWVKHTDFDLAMMALEQKLGGRRPNDNRFRHLMEDYASARELIERKARIKSDQKSFKLAEFVGRIRKMPADDPAAMVTALDSAVSKHPRNASLLGFCAQQKRRLKDNEGARSLYEAARRVDPDNVQNLCHYSSFVVDIDCDLDGPTERLDFARSLLKRACASDPYNVLALGAYASFLWTHDKNPDLAEDFYQRALQADLGNSETLASYANFLWRARGRDRFEEALEYYERSYVRNPASLRMLANFSQLLFLTDQKGRARDYAASAQRRAPSEAVRLEAAFYLFCHDKKENRAAHLRSIRVLIDAGVTSPKWDLSPTVEQAAKEGHDQINLVRTLEKVISDGADAKGLAEFVAWQTAV